MSLETTEFEFPDEASENPRAGGKVVQAQVETKSNEVDIEIVDDTPVEDRNRKPMDEPPKDMGDEELAKYDESVRKRIQHFTKGYHEERRAKEMAQREKDEAIRIAQSIIEENKQLRGTLHEGQGAYIEQAKLVAANDLERAKRQYKSAYEAGDSDALVDAQEALTTAKMHAERVNNFTPTPLQEREIEVKTQSQQEPAPKIDARLSEWQDKNSWFGNNQKMTAYALGLHSELVSEGIPVGSEEYYDRIDTDIRKRFSDSFEPKKQVDAQTPSKQSNVVAPATRSTAPRKVVLTKTQVDLAKRLGVPLELYARKVAEEMRK
jgi:hypothetical protein